MNFSIWNRVHYYYFIWNGAHVVSWPYTFSVNSNIDTLQCSIERKSEIGDLDKYTNFDSMELQLNSQKLSTWSLSTWLPDCHHQKTSHVFAFRNCCLVNAEMQTLFLHNSPKLAIDSYNSVNIKRKSHLMICVTVAILYTIFGQNSWYSRTPYIASRYTHTHAYSWCLKP